jgi:acyl-CoA reductase-like NAD-dependent aldehyde dehydrogenase
LLLELGGKASAIVAEDADLDEASAHIVWAHCRREYASDLQ